MITLSIDPATHGCGCALFENRELFAAGYAPNLIKNTDEKEENIVRRCTGSAVAAMQWAKEHVPVGAFGSVVIDQMVVELPQVYSRGANKTKGDPNKNVLPLAMVDAALAALLPDVSVYSYQPHAWKKGTAKPDAELAAKLGVKRTEMPYVITTRVKLRLSRDELARVDWSKSVEHSWDVADAIGVGLHHLSRFERHRVLARE